MITIVYKSGTEVEWHTGDSKEISLEEVDLVDADGDELGLLLREFHNLVYHNGRVNTWHGDTAMTIVDRLAQLSDKNKKFGRNKESKG